MLPKFPIPASQGSNWTRSLISLLAYIAIGLFIFPNYKVLLILVLIVLLHEAGHLLAMRAFKYKDTGIFFIPFVGGFASGTKREISQRESAIVIACGPLPGMLIGALLIMAGRYNETVSFGDISWTWTGMLFLSLNALNLLPVYPLDGGQLLNRVFLDEEGLLSNVFIFISALVLAALAVYLKFYPLLLFPLMMLWRLRPDPVSKKMEARIEAAGIKTDLDYEDLPDADYWKLREILIDLHPAFAGSSKSADLYDEKEERIQAAISSLLHRHLIQDLSLHAKIMMGTLWALALVMTVKLLFLER